MFGTSPLGGRSPSALLGGSVPVRRRFSRRRWRVTPPTPRIKVLSALPPRRRLRRCGPVHSPPPLPCDPPRRSAASPPLALVLSLTPQMLCSVRRKTQEPRLLPLAAYLMISCESLRARSDLNGSVACSSPVRAPVSERLSCVRSACPSCVRLIRRLSFVRRVCAPVSERLSCVQSYTLLLCFAAANE